MRTPLQKYTDWGLWVLLLISLTFSLSTCGMIHKKNDLSALVKNSSNSKPPVYKEVAPITHHKDTVISHYSDTPKIAHIRHSEKTLIQDGLLPSYDSLLRQHFTLATHWARAADTARVRKHKLDSTDYRYKQLIGKVDHILKNQDINDKQTAAYKSQAIMDTKISDWVFWSAVAGILLLQIINVAYAHKNHVRRPKPYTL